MPRPLTRREMLARCANGFGALALTALMADKSFGGVVSSGTAGNSLAVGQYWTRGGNQCSANLNAGKAPFCTNSM